jgi:hypothetical protein
MDATRPPLDEVFSRESVARDVATTTTTTTTRRTRSRDDATVVGRGGKTA